MLIKISATLKTVAEDFFFLMDNIGYALWMYSTKDFFVVLQEKNFEDK
jgi:hypothetical protein